MRELHGAKTIIRIVLGMEQVRALNVLPSVLDRPDSTSSKGAIHMLGRRVCSSLRETSSSVPLKILRPCSEATFVMCEARRHLCCQGTLLCLGVSCSELARHTNYAMDPNT
jgi:hypothetical protein